MYIVPMRLDVAEWICTQEGGASLLCEGVVVWVRVGGTRKRGRGASIRI